ncbi:MAG: TRAP transporter substrate-binding protein [Halomonas sp.]|jgi:tripartite ATP-independent transporter DctP family solute receptor|uniref:TRAP transporter substrate-binding protein n=1 Tax=Billgrantia tianxiuensis TaxID=2497861 RepID=A0A6I6SHB2_9GAMM|nr:MULTISPECIES: TRAP transporter substrate-binding protein [Halomonas]MCE8033162.1 TRAP transporter substrate-binding protein [Halomonas sp. MCCC 1A11057]MDX5435299.1 TRAP transporter substrate-binding protein [Halomonas sp.]QHC48922.1 TRAP transporter substrate-binding protein [Halomonas tianxiuensis]
MKCKLPRLLTAVAVGLGIAGSATAAELELRAATIGSQQGIQMAGLNALASHVAEATAEGVEVRLFHSGALGDQVSNIESLDTRTLDIATIETPITTVDEDMGILSLPYLFRDRDHVASVLGGEIGDALKQRLQEQGYRVIGFYEGGFRHITNNRRAIETPDDLSGLRIRTPGSRQRVEMFNAYGANASPLPYPELYSALQTGVFDGQENPLVEVEASRFYEVQDYLSLSGHVYTVGFLLMNEARFQDLPDEVQQALLEGGQKAFDATADFGERADQSVIELVEQNGMQVNEVDLDAFIEASQPLWERFTQDMSDEARELVQRIAEHP